LAAAALWVRSYRAADELGWETVNWTAGASSQKGRVVIGAASEPSGFGGRGFQRDFGQSPEQFTFEDLFGDTGHEWMGFGFADFTSTGQTLRFIMLPMWFVCILFALGPGVWLTCRLKQRRRCDGRLCAVCGYDLRATPDRCPECGTVPAQNQIGPG
jgi:hypothetical protein